jgi:hypothetical protein
MLYGVALAGIRMRRGNADLQIGTARRASGNLWECLSTQRLRASRRIAQGWLAPASRDPDERRTGARPASVSYCPVNFGGRLSKNA